MSLKRNQTTIVDIAKLVGVSPKTVSRVLNNEPYVKQTIRDQVLNAVKELNYHPNIVAQGLVGRRSFLIGLVYENPSPSYVVELQMGALERLKGERYRLAVLPVQSVSNNAEDIVRMLRSAALDGVVLTPPASDHPLIIKELTAARLPFVRIAPTRFPEIGPSNLMNDVSAAYEIAAYVIGLGHRDIAIIKGDPTHHCSEARLLGYSQAMAAAGIPIRLDRIETGMFTFETGFDAANRLLKCAQKPTAILAQNDDMAVGAMMAARELGLDVPRDLSIVGYDDSEISRIVWPRLTTIQQPVSEMARVATDTLLALLEGRPVVQDTPHEHHLLIRQSAAAPACP